uniref:VQ domain-containing protein n=1 Tax=Kalanchoe fedtschenkoi TaxID=63787 RepID=A0A7N0TU49_KALFE
MGSTPPFSKNNNQNNVMCPPPSPSTSTMLWKKVNRCSQLIKKPPPQQHRHPVIIYTHSPKVIHTKPQDFMALVQKLTGHAASECTTLQNPPTSHHRNLPMSCCNNADEEKKKVAPLKNNNCSNMVGAGLLMDDTDNSSVTEDRPDGGLPPLFDPPAVQPNYDSFPFFTNDYADNQNIDFPLMINNSKPVKFNNSYNHNDVSNGSVCYSTDAVAISPLDFTSSNNASSLWSSSLSIEAMREFSNSFTDFS